MNREARGEDGMEPADDRPSRAPGDDEAALVDSSIEPPVAHRDEAKVADRDRAASMPGRHPRGHYRADAGHRAAEDRLLVGGRVRRYEYGGEPCHKQQFLCNLRR